MKLINTTIVYLLTQDHPSPAPQQPPPQRYAPPQQAPPPQRYVPPPQPQQHVVHHHTVRLLFISSPKITIN